MDRKQVENHIKKLIDLKNSIESHSPNAEISDEFTKELNNALLSLNKDIQTEMTKTVQKQPTLDVRFKKLTPDAVTPTYAKKCDAGLDITATRVSTNTTFQVIYDTGLAIEIPEGYVGLVIPRSSIRDYELELTNSVGVIDAGFRGQIEVTFNKTNGPGSLKYNAGDRVAQIIILPFPLINLIESDVLTKTERNDGGYGHTGT